MSCFRIFKSSFLFILSFKIQGQQSYNLFTSHLLLIVNLRTFFEKKTKLKIMQRFRKNSTCSILTFSDYEDFVGKKT